MQFIKNMMMFLKEGKFYIHLGIVIAVFFVIMFVSYKMLNGCTRHGEEIKMPDFVGRDAEWVVENYSSDFDFILVDSIYVKDMPVGSVYQQNPRANSNVKRGRNVYYIVVSKSPETVQMPNLRNLSLRQALTSLNTLGLNVNTLNFVEHIAKNAVVQQYVDGIPVEPGTILHKGTDVTLDVGIGNGSKKTYVPNLIGKTIGESKTALYNVSLNLGETVFAGTDDIENLRVWKMKPSYSSMTMVELGTPVNIWLCPETNFDFEKLAKLTEMKDSLIDANRQDLSDEELDFLIDSVDCLIEGREFSRDIGDSISSTDENLEHNYDNVEIDDEYYYDE